MPPIRPLAVLALICATLTQPAALAADDWLAKPAQTLRWGDWDRVQLRAGDGGVTPANQHPVALDAREIGSRLAQIAIEREGRREAVFSEDEIARLAPAIASALARARPDQDLLFLSSGKRSFFAETLASSGRIFFADGALNLIFGSTLSDELEDLTMFDHRSPPVEYGSRHHPPRGVMLATPRGDASLASDNWIRFPLASAAPASPSGHSEAPGSRPPARAPRDTAQRLQELEKLQRAGLIDEAEFARKKREIENPR